MDWGDPGDEAPAFLIDAGAHSAFAVRGVVRIGRAPENTIVVTDPTVSRLHAEVWREGEKVLLRSLGSNGTRINSHRVPGTWELEEGDTVDIGWASFTFTAESLPFGIHATARGIASSRRSEAAAGAEATPGSRSTVVLSAAKMGVTSHQGTEHVGGRRETVGKRSAEPSPKGSASPVVIAVAMVALMGLALWALW